MTNSVVVSCQNVSKTYTGIDAPVTVLNNISLDIHAGQRMAIIGASGSGKSTLLHLLGGLDKPSSGTVAIQGQDLGQLSNAAKGHVRNRSLGFVYQFHHLLPEFTAVQNVAMPLLIRREKTKVALDKARKLLAKVGLAERVEHKPAEMSGGERQRAAIARALVTEPACILADEPTGNLDNNTADGVFELMLELNKSLSTSLVVVTHDQELAARMDTIYTLDRGQLKTVTDMGPK